MDVYFTYDPENNDFETFATFEEQSKASEEIIRDYLADSPDERWPEEVVNIVSGIITKRATICEIVARPEVIDEDGFDKDGDCWPDGMTHRCNYEMDEVIEEEGVNE